MKILPKWTVVFLFTGFYVFILAGIFYSNLFRWFFEEKLKQEIVALLYVNQNRFISGIVASPKVVTIEEVDTMQNFLKDSRIVHAILINKYGQIRWSPDTAMFGKRIEEYQAVRALPTDSIARSYVTKSPKYASFDRESKNFYEVAVPLVSQGEVRGVISIEVSREETKATLAQGMTRFYTGAVGVVIVFLVTGVFFIYKIVLTPLSEIQDTIESISIVHPAWPKDQFRADEFGQIQKTIAVFLDKLRATMARMEKDRRDLGELEKNRWDQILKVLVRSGGAMVLDGDNYVLASHNLGAVLAKSPASATVKTVADVFKGNTAAAPVSVASAPSKTHLLDMITSAELLQLINKALERPGNFFEGGVTLDAQLFGARVITISATQPQDQRTLVWLDSRVNVKT